MCGIVGGVAERDIAPVLLEGLKRLEYRGYDSAGVAVLDQQGNIERVRICGKVAALKEALQSHPLRGNAGVAHTRWATHGKPNELNAHPQMSGDKIALVHNGIIENYQLLKDVLSKKGVEFTSQTDTEVIAHLLRFALEANGGDLLKATQSTVSQLEGAYSLAVVARGVQDRIIGARHGSPLVIGIGIGETYVASDMLALLPVTQTFVVLEEGDVAEIFKERYQIYDRAGKPIDRPVKEVTLSVENSEKGPFRHYMLKEIFEQPQAISDTLAERLKTDEVDPVIFGPSAEKIFPKVEEVHIVACGTSYHAGRVAQAWLQEMLGIPCVVDIASEMRHMRQTTRPNTLFVTLSQSGETADTLAALRSMKDNPNYLAKLCICNVPESSLVRESDMSFLTLAGPEIGVASTKAFTTQLVALLLLVMALGKTQNRLSEKDKDLISHIRRLPHLVEKTLELDLKIQKLSERFEDKRHALFLGRGLLYPIAMEGALKLKEISYIHAESYPAGELKHGPLALVDKEMPVVALACNDSILDKLRANLEVVRARHGQLIVFSTQDVDMGLDFSGVVIEVPKVPEALAPILLTIPMQLLAYHVAVLKGTDVDQPRNLAKSVTVE